MKLLVTGSNGFLAGSVIAQVPTHITLHGLCRNKLEKSSIDIVHHAFDLTDFNTLEEIIHSIRPDAIIHTAAISNIDTCETNKITAEHVNVEVTRQLAQLANDIDCKLIFCSTDSIFDGIHGFYTEEDIPHAVNVYAATKIKAEQIVLKANKKNAVARFSLIVGLPVINAGNSFLSTLIDKIKKGDDIQLPSNEIRTPIDVITAGKALIELAENDFSGIIHLAGNTSLTRYELGLEIASIFNFPKHKILPINSNSMPGRAPRPNNASLDNSKAKQYLKTPMLSIDDGLTLSLNFKLPEDE